MNIPVVSKKNQTHGDRVYDSFDTLSTKQAKQTLLLDIRMVIAQGAGRYWLLQYFLSGVPVSALIHCEN